MRLEKAFHVPWTELTQLAQQLQKLRPKDERLLLHKACQGSALDLSSPPVRQKSPELQARLAQLQEKLDAQKYEHMVADVTQQVANSQLLPVIAASTLPVQQVPITR